MCQLGTLLSGRKEVVKTIPEEHQKGQSGGHGALEPQASVLKGKGTCVYGVRTPPYRNPSNPEWDSTGLRTAAILTPTSAEATAAGSIHAPAPHALLDMPGESCT